MKTNKYYCKYCEKVISKKSNKQWILSYCEKKGKEVKCYKVLRIDIKK